MRESKQSDSPSGFQRDVFHVRKPAPPLTWGEAITRAHARGDTEERNRLMALANSHVTIRELQELLGCALDTAHRWTVAGRGGNPCSRLNSPAPTSTLVRTQGIGRGEVAPSPGRGPEPISEVRHNAAR